MPTLWGVLQISFFLLVACIVGFNLRQMTYALLSIVSEIQVFEKRVFYGSWVQPSHRAWLVLPGSAIRKYVLSLTI